MQVIKNEKILKLESEQICEIMPHQDPFLFLNKATISENSATGTYEITGKEYFLKGHFKKQPIFPASIMMEAIGQLGVLFLLTSKNQNLAKLHIDNKRIMFTHCDECRCHMLCKPGDILDLNLKLEKIRVPFIKFKDCIVNNSSKKVFKTNRISLVFDLKKIKI